MAMAFGYFAKFVLQYDQQERLYKLFRVIIYRYSSSRPIAPNRLAAVCTL
jgi:hypothetical protein